jgi:NAD(P)-dependent dehydrogenase (short-subunit alcohol dehydrogenase family)
MGQRLSDEVAIVTGGASGIGEAIALGLASEGAHVCIADIHRDEADKIKTRVERLNRKAIAIKTDVSRQGDTRLMVEQTMSVFGKIDILVNNAGIARYAPFLEYSYDDWKRTLEVNLTGYFLCAQEVAKQMIQRKKGKILNVSSIVAQVAVPNSVAYSVSKGGIISFTRVLALELASYGICVNAIAPGPIMTAMARTALKEEDRVAREAMIPIGRYGVTEDLIGPVIFLASSESNYVTGQTLFVDGGYLISGVPRKLQA